MYWRVLSKELSYDYKIVDFFLTKSVLEPRGLDLRKMKKESLASLSIYHCPWWDLVTFVFKCHLLSNFTFFSTRQGEWVESIKMSRWFTEGQGRGKKDRFFRYGVEFFWKHFYTFYDINTHIFKCRHARCDCKLWNVL